MDPQVLPPDAQFKGYVDVVVQDVSFQTDNVLFRKETFYSPGEQRTDVADLPAGLAFSTVAVLAYGCGSLRSARFASLFFGLCLINEPALITLPRSTTE